jgi:hypothetical protein
LQAARDSSYRFIASSSPAERHVQVRRCLFQVRVPQHGLHVVQRPSSLNKPGARFVPQIVEAQVGDTGPPAGGAPSGPDRPDPPADHVPEHEVFRRRRKVVWTTATGQHFQYRQQAAGDRNHSLLAVLCLPRQQPQTPTREVHFPPLESRGESGRISRWATLSGGPKPDVGGALSFEGLLDAAHHQPAEPGGGAAGISRRSASIATQSPPPPESVPLKSVPVSEQDDESSLRSPAGVTSLQWRPRWLELPEDRSHEERLHDYAAVTRPSRRVHVDIETGWYHFDASGPGIDNGRGPEP